MAMRDTVPCVVVMLGGDNRRPGSARKWLLQWRRLRAFAQSEPMRLVLIPSPRTPAALIETLGAELGEADIHIVSRDEANPYPGILGVADAIIVTSDSVNMASEAAITGKPVLIAGWNVAAGTGTDRVAAGSHRQCWGAWPHRRLSPTHDRRRSYRSTGSRIAADTLYRT